MQIQKIDKNMVSYKQEVADLKWYDIDENNFLIEGIAFFNPTFHRLNGLFVTEALNNLSLHPSGMYIDFITNSTSINLNVVMQNIAYMDHMTAVGQSGFDLYVRVGDKWVFLNSTKINKLEYQLTLVKEMDKKARLYRLYFPLYNGVKSVQVGIDSNADLIKPERTLTERIICYGTSITQGGCATRSGMNYSSILGRNIDYEIINLGFSGSAKLEIEIADFINTITNKKYLIIEAEANSAGNGALEKNMQDFIERIISQNPNLKIYVLSRYPYSITLVKKEIRKLINYYHNYQKKLVAGFNNPLIEFIDGKRILKDFNYEETVDGVHLTDLGFYFVAMYMLKKIKRNEKIHE